MFKNPKSVPFLLSCCCRCCHSDGRRHGPTVDGEGRGGVGVKGFETLAFGPGTSPLLSLDPTLFLFIGPTAVTSYAHHGAGAGARVSVPHSLPFSLPRSVAQSLVQCGCRAQAVVGRRGGGRRGARTNPFLPFPPERERGFNPLICFFSFSFSPFFDSRRSVFGIPSLVRIPNSKPNR